MSVELSYDSKRLTNAFTSPFGRLVWRLALLPRPHRSASLQYGPLGALPGETVKCNITFTTKWLQFIVTGVKMPKYPLFSL